MITKVGTYPDLDVEEYHADPFDGGSLSHSGAKTLVTKTPALFAWEREHGRPNKASFDFGHAAHRVVLGDGMDIVRVEADSWRSKAAKEQAEEARAGGAVPLLAADVDTVQAMASALREHPLASRLLAAGSGTPEVSAFARDDLTGITMRCRYDWLPPSIQGRRLIISDYKSCVSADPEEFGKAAGNYGYALQDVWYSAIASALELAEQVSFLFIAQEKTAPYLVNVIQLDHTAKQIGAIQMRRALNLFRQCTDTGTWPGYPADKPALTSLPIWVERQYESEIAS